MRKHIFALSIVMVLLLSMITPSVGGPRVFAQEPVCTDAAGAVIPCPPEEGDSGGGRKTATPVPPTSTPLPLTNPTQETVTADWTGACPYNANLNNCITVFADLCSDEGGEANLGPDNEKGYATVECTFPSVLVEPTPRPIGLPESDYLGSCTNDNFAECRDQFKCEDGLLVIEVDLYAPGGTKYDFYCIPHEDAPELNLPIAIPDDGPAENWTGGCSDGPGLDACLDIYGGACADDGGELSVWYDDDGAGVYCENQSEAGQVAPTAILPVAAPGGENPTSGETDESASANNLKQIGIATIVVLILLATIVVWRKALNRRVEVKLSK